MYIDVSELTPGNKRPKADCSCKRQRFKKEGNNSTYEYK